SLEQALEFCADDECVEVLGPAVRLRKTILDAKERGRARGRASRGTRPARRPAPALTAPPYRPRFPRSRSRLPHRTHKPHEQHYSFTSTMIITFPWLIRASWWIRGSIVHQNNH